MRIQDIIRNMIDMIDGVQQEQEPEQTTIIVAHPTATIDEPADASPLTHGDDIRRFKQIVDLADKQTTEYTNTPKEEYAGVESVTTDAGGGWMEPKHTKDIRGNSSRIYGDN